MEIYKKLIDEISSNILEAGSKKSKLENSLIYASDESKKISLEKEIEDLDRMLVQMESNLEKYERRLKYKIDVDNGSDISVYVGRSSIDQSDHISIITNSLSDHGCSLFSPNNDSEYGPDFDLEVSNLVNQSQLSVVVVGETSGGILDGSEKSILESQIAIIKDSKKEGVEKNLIWIPEGLIPKGPNQTQFIESLQVDEEINTRYEIIIGDVQYFLDSVLVSLKKINDSQSVSNVVNNSVYIVCDKSDQDEGLIDPLMNSLLEKGQIVEFPLFDGTPEEYQEIHNETLSECDATILFYGNGNDYWFKSNKIRMDKSIANKRQQPIKSFSIFFAEPSGNHKEKYLTSTLNPLLPQVRNKYLIINGLEGFDKDLIQPFIQKIIKDD